MVVEIILVGALRDATCKTYKCRRRFSESFTIGETIFSVYPTKRFENKACSLL